MTESATLVDTNVLLDVITRDQNWFAWSISCLDAAALGGTLVINDVIYAELSIRYPTIEALEAVMGQTGIVMTPIPRAALFLAGKVFQRYRATGGVRTGVLPDFFIGAHSAVTGLRLITRDTRRYRTYFPDIDLITPEGCG